MTVDQMFVLASGEFLTKHLPDDWRDMSNEDVHQFLIDNAWEPLQDVDPNVVWDMIDGCVRMMMLVTENE